MSSIYSEIAMYGSDLMDELSDLKKEFPQLTAIDVPAYDIQYQKKGSFIIKIISQLGKVFRGIKREHTITQQLIKEHNIDLIISDNRYGIYSKNIFSVIISHQMMVKIPKFKIAEPFVYLWLQYQHRKFDAIWIPDVKNESNISGDCLININCLSTHNLLVCSPASANRKFNRL